jgi:hypothetical protein
MQLGDWTQEVTDQMKKALTLVLCGLLLASAGLAQTEKEEPQLPLSSSLNMSNQIPSSGLSLIDPSRLHNYNQMIVSYNSAMEGGYQGLFLSTFDYNLARPLDMSFTLGASFTPQGDFGSTNQGQFFLSNFNLRYQPTESSTIEFHYQDARGLTPYYYANPLANRWWYRNR